VRNIKWIRSAVLAVATAAMAGLTGATAAPATAASAASVRVVDLGTLGGLYSEAIAINDRGQVVGSSSIDPDVFSDSHAFRWDACRAYRTPDGRIGPLPAREELEAALLGAAA